MKALIILLCSIPLWAQADIFSAKVIAVMDGDTVMVLRGGQKQKIRLANIDAPEKDQTFGKQSRDSLLEMVGKKQVQIDSQAVDQYGRIIGLISVDGRNVNQEQVKRGMAWEYSHYHSDKTYIGLQSDAQQSRRGLWTQTSPQAPWQWRSRHVTGETASHSTKPANIAGQVDGYGEASRLREPPPAARPAIEGLQPDELGRRKLHPSTGPAPQANQHAASSPVPTVLYDLECGKKRYCSEMSSCDEAHFYLARCGVKMLDRNEDGVPCESLCSGKE